LATIRTVLDLAEKCLDGCPIWGPKAAVAAVSESIELVQVRPSRSVQQCLAEVVSAQTQLENEEGIDDVVDLVQRTVKMLNPSTAISMPTAVSPALQSRISRYVSYVPCNIVSDVCLMLYRDLESIRASTAKWTIAEKKLPRRLLDARRVAKELESVMKKITQANELFIVLSLYQQDDTAPLILALDGDYGEHGNESQGNP
jgi:hypothetical protein